MRWFWATLIYLALTAAALAAPVPIPTVASNADLGSLTLGAAPNGVQRCGYLAAGDSPCIQLLLPTAGACAITGFVGTVQTPQGATTSQVNVTAVVSGSLRTGLVLPQPIFPVGTIVTSQISGTAGGVGIYQVSQSFTPPPSFQLTVQGDGATQIPSADGGCWVATAAQAANQPSVLDIRMFGANTTSDAAPAIAAAFAACGQGQRVLIPMTVQIATPITVGNAVNCELTGNGRYGISMLMPTATFPAGTNMFKFTGPGGQPSNTPVGGTNSFAIRDLAVDCRNAALMDSYVFDIEQTTNVIVDSTFFYKCPKLFDLLQDGTVFVNNLTALTLKATTGIGFQIQILGEFRAQNFYYDSDNPGGINTDGAAFFNFVGGAGFILETGTIAHIQDGVVIAPQGGAVINAFQIGDGVYIDQTSDVAVRIQPAGAGNVVENGVVGGHLWTSDEGLLINTNGGSVGNVRVTADFYNHLKNAIDLQGAPTLTSIEGVRANGYGCQTTGTANTAVAGNVVTLVSQAGCGLNTAWGGQQITINSVVYTIGTIINGNSFSVTTNPGNQSGVAYSFAPAASGGAGVNIGASVPNATIRNSELGPGSFVATSRGWGVFNLNATVTLVMQNNDMRQNSVAPINTFSCGGGCRWEGNNGLNPLGATTNITVGPTSPATICAGPAWETHYFLQAAPNTGTVSIAGVVFGTTSSQTLPLVTTLGPGECEVVTWATTAPVYNKFIH